MPSKHILALTIGLSFSAATVHAEEYRQHEAHVHGHAEFNIAQDGHDLDLPSENNNCHSSADLIHKARVFTFCPFSSFSAPRCLQVNHSWAGRQHGQSPVG